MRICFVWLIIPLIFFAESGNSQNWKNFSRNQKDSVIDHTLDKGNKSVGVGIGFTILGGGWKGGAIKIEPAFGYLFMNQQQLIMSFIYENGNIQIEDSYKKSTQYRLGNYYRFYLPQRKVITPFFIQAGIQYGYFKGERNVDGEFLKADSFEFTVVPGVGMMPPINKFRIELMISTEIELIQNDLIKYLSGPRAQGQITFSFYFN